MDVNAQIHKKIEIKYYFFLIIFEILIQDQIII